MAELYRGNQGVDRREETVVTQQPGYTSSEQVVQDVAAERRNSGFQLSRIIWTLLGILEILLALRFVLKLIAANPNSGFAQFIYSITGPFLAPFAGLTATPATGGVVLEVTTLIAMAVYALFVWIVVALLQVLLDRPSARSVTRSVQEKTPVVSARVRPAASTNTSTTTQVEQRRTVTR